MLIILHIKSDGPQPRGRKRIDEPSSDGKFHPIDDNSPNNTMFSKTRSSFEQIHNFKPRILQAAHHVQICYPVTCMLIVASDELPVVTVCRFGT